MDLIDRQAAIAKFEQWLKVDGYSEGELNMLKAVLYELRSLPSAEPERKKGEWIPMQVSSGRDSWKCSVCGRRARGKKENLPFCHCGADMRKEKNDGIR